VTEILLTSLIACSLTSHDRKQQSVALGGPPDMARRQIVSSAKVPFHFEISGVNIRHFIELHGRACR
jgi:hypothetical protein